MKKKVLIIGVAILVIILILIGLYFHGLTSVSNKSEEVTFNASGTGKQVINDLYEAHLIKSKISSMIYLKLHPSIVIKAGSYKLDRINTTQEIFEILSDGNKKDNTISVLFLEGKRVPDIVKVISDNFSYEEEDIYKVINDQVYLKELINKYDFLTNDILNSDIYYPLEGYLFPAKYEFYKDASIKSIIEKMLDKTEIVLDNISTSLEKSDRSVHEILTIASIIENETKYEEDRPKVSQVIYKRLSINMSLGMDVTTYYGVKKALNESLTQSDLDNKNAYNTRRTDFVGLPVGPICNPREDAIKAALNPSDTDYLYFYADVYGKGGKEGKLYFAKNYDEFKKLINKYS